MCIYDFYWNDLEKPFYVPRIQYYYIICSALGPESLRLLWLASVCGARDCGIVAGCMSQARLHSDPLASWAEAYIKTTGTDPGPRTITFKPRIARIFLAIDISNFPQTRMPNRRVAFIIIGTEIPRRSLTQAITKRQPLPIYSLRSVFSAKIPDLSFYAQ